MISETIFYNSVNISSKHAFIQIVNEAHFKYD